MPRLYNDLFEELNEEYVDLRSDNIHELIEKKAKVQMNLKINLVKCLKTITPTCQNS